jgi:Fungal specific transcription factor domain
MLSVCAVSARFSTHPKLNTQPAFLRGESWAAPAREIVMKRYDWPNITILTCLLLLAQHEFGTCYGRRSWALGGMAIRMAYTLQLHKDLDYDPLIRTEKVPLSFIDREVRRRTMWACFLMDRFTSSGTNRPMFVKEETIKAQLPIKEQFFQLDIEGPTEDLKGSVPHPASADSGQLSNAKENMGVAAYTIRAISLWGRIVIYLFQSDREVDEHAIWDPKAKFTELAKEADDFLDTLPDSLKYTTENLRTHDTEGLSTQYLFLHLAAQQNILFLNHIAAHGSQTGKPCTDAPRDFVAKTSAKAYEASKCISEILRDSESNPVNTPFGGYCAFWSSSVQMPAIFSKNSTMEAEAKKNLATNVRYLFKMKRHWGAFYWTSQHLKEQYKACADTARQGPGRSSAPTVSSIYHYGDWFDRYPHGVSETDFEDPLTNVKKEVGGDAVLQQKNDYHTVQEFFSTLSPAPPRLEREPTKSLSRENAKKNAQVPPQTDSRRLSSENNLDSGPAAQILDTSNHELAQQYSQMGPDNNGNMYAHPAYYGQTNVFHPPQQPMLQLDRHLVFGEYSGGGDLLGFNGPNMMDTAGWDINMGNMMNGWMEDPSSAWFVPFNMGPPGVGQDGDVFNSLGGSGVNYQMGGMSIDNMGNGNGMAGSNDGT